MFDDFDTQIHPEETKECREYQDEREETNEAWEAMELSELAADLEWDAHWAEFDSINSVVYRLKVGESVISILIESMKSDEELCDDADMYGVYR
jgi:hypothetical protein